MIITKLRMNHLENPLGYSLQGLSASWIVEEAKGKKQKAAQVIVATDEAFKDIQFDSGEDTRANNIAYPITLDLQPCTRYYWKVKVWSDAGEAEESEMAFFETGLMDQSWQASWITADTHQDQHPLLRKTFELEKEIASARAYVTGLGIYELEINGRKVGDEYLLPGFHSYDFWVQYQTFDVTSYLAKGINVVGALLGNGWYKGRFGFNNDSNLYGEKMHLLCQLVVQYKDGSQAVICTDESWKSHEGPVTFSGIYDGEVYDANKAIADWSLPELDDSSWNRTKICIPENIGPVKERLSLPIKIVETIQPAALIRTPKDELVIDFGQIITGWVSFKVDLPKGQSIKLSHGEILQDDCFYNDNLRSAKAEYTYISNGRPDIIRPHFTFYGFRFVKVEGLETINLTDFTGCVVMSEMERTGFIETGDQYVNRLTMNALWSQKCNFLDVPTDCPQRDERMGWTGDAQIFAGTACFNMYTPAFFTKYIQDMNYEQSILNGSVPHVVPRLKPKNSDGMMDAHGASPWGDAAVIIPWTIYQHYGDKNLLANQYDGMRAWVDYIISQDQADGDKKLWLTGFHFADWLALDNLAEPNSPLGGTDSHYIASAFYYYSTNIVAKAAKVLGKDADATAYAKRAEEIRQAICDEFFSKNGRSTITTQTALVVALYMDLLPEAYTARNAEQLKELIRKNNMHLNTGFVGTPYLCPVLTKIGADDYAYKLLFNDDFPSWLYEVKMGATTIWERWNSVLPDGKISSTGMNSLNHYAYGSIVEWIYRCVCGLNQAAETPGFKKALLTPHPNGRLKKAIASVKTAAGEYTSGWEVHEDGHLTFTIRIPFDSEAELLLPDADATSVTICPANIKIEQYGKDVKAMLLTGTYTISYVPTKTYLPVFTFNDTLKDVLGNPKARAVLEKYAGKALRAMSQMIADNGSTTVEAFINNFMVANLYNPADQENIRHELSQIQSI